MKTTFHPIEFADAIFTVYKKNEGGRQTKPSLLSTEELPKLSNEKSIDLGMGDTNFPNFVLFTIDEFERNLYLFYLNGMNTYPRIEMKFNTSSADPVQCNKSLQNNFDRNYASQHKEFKCCFAFQDPLNPIPACKLYLNWKLYSLI